MNDSMLGRFFGVAVRSRTWLNVLFQWLAFPLGLFYFIFLVTGLSVGLGLVVVWVGIPILLIVAGAWWLFGAFERVQAKYLLGADVPLPPRAWESANGVWGKLKAHFGSAATWKDLLYLLAKLAFGIVSTTLLMTVAGALFWCLAAPIAAIWRVDVITTSGGGWHPPLWLGLLGIPAGFLVFFIGLHVLNGWGWVCRLWAELLFTAAPETPPPAALTLPPAAPPGAIAPLVSVAPPPPDAPIAPPAPTVGPAPPGARAPGARSVGRIRGVGDSRRAPDNSNPDRTDPRGHGGDVMRTQRVMRTLRPSAVLVVLALALIVLGLVLPGLATAASATPYPHDHPGRDGWRDTWIHRPVR